MTPLTQNFMSVDSLLERLAQRTEVHTGYPYNLDFDYQKLWPLLKYMLNNLGDPYVDGNYGINSKDFEREVVRYFASLYHLPEDDAWGYVTASGTEGNLYGLLLGRELYPNGILYGSEDCHYSVGKAARMFRLPFVQVRSQSNGEIDYDALYQVLASNRNPPAIINVNVGTTIKGAVDDLDKIVNILEDLKIKRFHLHVDGALGGMLLPFMDGAFPIDFTRYPIGSMAISGHKFIGSPVPCGIALARKHQVQSFDVEYIGSTDTTIMGSRNGLTPVILWEAIQRRRDKFAQEVAQCRQNAEYLYSQLIARGSFALLNDFSTTVVFDRPPEIIAKRWQLACYSRIAHIVVMQNHTPELLDRFLREVALSPCSPDPEEVEVA
jgi:histidine decarboxylase